MDVLNRAAMLQIDLFDCSARTKYVNLLHRSPVGALNRSGAAITFADGRGPISSTLGYSATPLSLQSMEIPYAGVCGPLEATSESSFEKEPQSLESPIC